MNVELHPATENDRAFFRQVHHRAYRSVIESMFGWDEAYQDKAADKDFDERTPHIIRCDGAAAGVVGWVDRGDHIWFGPLFILPEHQGKGIGTILMQNLIELARGQARAIKLQTLKENTRAKAWYERLGFTVVAVDDHHWQLEYDV